MKRESDLIQKLLVKLEELPAQPGDMFVFNGTDSEVAVEGYSSDQIEYHLTLLKSEGFIDSPGSQPMLGVTFRGLTPHGHDYLDQCREADQRRKAEEAAAESQKWVSAAEAARLLKPVFKSEHLAQMTICKRAHGGLIRAHAERFLMDKKERSDFEIPKEFWFAEGHEALTQNWTAGDFDSWVDSNRFTGNCRFSGLKVHMEAFAVSFLRPDIEKLIPTESVQPVAPPSSTAVGGRPPADWWEDLLIDLCFKHFHGELPHQKQADIVRAMQEWITAHGYDASESTIKIRARKLADAIKRDAEN
jgi:Hypothetical protein (DUF2513)